MVKTVKYEILQGLVIKKHKLTGQLKRNYSIIKIYCMDFIMPRSNNKKII